MRVAAFFSWQRARLGGNVISRRKGRKAKTPQRKPERRTQADRTGLRYRTRHWGKRSGTGWIAEKGIFGCTEGWVRQVRQTAKRIGQVFGSGRFGQGKPQGSSGLWTKRSPRGRTGSGRRQARHFSNEGFGMQRPRLGTWRPSCPPPLYLFEIPEIIEAQSGSVPALSPERHCCRCRPRLLHLWANS